MAGVASGVEAVARHIIQTRWSRSIISICNTSIRPQPAFSHRPTTTVTTILRLLPLLPAARQDFLDTMRQPSSSSITTISNFVSVRTQPGSVHRTATVTAMVVNHINSAIITNSSSEQLHCQLLRRPAATARMLGPYVPATTITRISLTAKPTTTAPVTTVNQTIRTTVACN